MLVLSPAELGRGNSLKHGRTIGYTPIAMAIPRMMNSTHGIATLFPKARYLAESEAPGMPAQPSGKPWSRSHSVAVSLLMSFGSAAAHVCANASEAARFAA